jgi:hypothetical protein
MTGWPNRPAIVYVTTNGGFVQLDDQADLAELPVRERAIARALMDLSFDRLNEADQSGESR